MLLKSKLYDFTICRHSIKIEFNNKVHLIKPTNFIFIKPSFSCFCNWLEVFYMINIQKISEHSQVYAFLYCLYLLNETYSFFIYLVIHLYELLSGACNYLVVLQTDLTTPHFICAYLKFCLFQFTE